MKLQYFIETIYGGNKSILAEGPWQTANEALRVADSEVGVTWRVVRLAGATGEYLPQTEWIDGMTGKPNPAANEMENGWHWYVSDSHGASWGKFKTAKAAMQAVESL